MASFWHPRTGFTAFLLHLSATTELVIINLIPQHDSQPDPGFASHSDTRFSQAFLDQFAAVETLQLWIPAYRVYREAIAAMDFFTVSTLTFGVLYCFFVIDHDRRKILHFNVTRNPSALWVVQQLREAWAYKQPCRFLLFDRDAKFGADVVSAVRDMGSQPTRTAFRCPWQNGVAERWVGSCRRDLLNHVIVLNERHLKRLMSSYLLYYHEDRTHLGLASEPLN